MDPTLEDDLRTLMDITEQQDAKILALETEMEELKRLISTLNLKAANISSSVVDVVPCSSSSVGDVPCSSSSVGDVPCSSSGRKQCCGTTLKGVQCKKTAGYGDYCHIHRNKLHAIDPNCVICYEKKAAVYYRSDCCKQDYCVSCVSKWGCENDNCPTCRKKIWTLTRLH
jgi:hypothetical protein